MDSLARFLTSRKGAWIAVLAFLLIVGGAMGALRGETVQRGMNDLPASAEAARAADLAKEFPDDGHSPALVVVTRADDGTFSDRDLGSLAQYGHKLAEPTGRKPLGPIPSEDRKAVMVGVDVDSTQGQDRVKEQINDLRDRAHSEAPADTKVEVTGGPAFGVDVAAAFKGANFTLLAVTVGIVALLLLLTYRSPVLWLFPLAVVAFADQLSNVVTAWVGNRWNLVYEPGIVSVLVFGAGTNYALLLVSRYREELRRHADHRAAMQSAWRTTAPAILASNVTVVLALLSLLFAAMPASRGLGVASAVGLLIALASVLFVLPALLSLVGRRVFWPFIPKVGEDSRDHEGRFSRVARAVTAKPLPTVLGSLAVLAVLASGLLGTRVGLTQLEQFTSQTESADGFRTLAAHYDAGEAQPNTVIARADRTDAVVEAAKGVDGIMRVQPVGTSDSGWVKLQAVGDSEPQSERSYDTVRRLRDAVHSVDGADAVVGGANAESLDARDTSLRDLTRVAPIILGIVFVILVVLLRALVAPIILTLVNLASAAASIGMGTFLGMRLFHFPALDTNVPLFAFLFLVALGIDYTIFLVHRAQHEAAEHGTVEGMVRAVGSTGVVITSAGIVLAAVFAALGVLPLVTMAQLGLIVGFGVVFDTLFVRTVLVPALFALVGDRMWWPGGLHRRATAAPAGDVAASDAHHGGATRAQR